MVAFEFGKIALDMQQVAAKSEVVDTVLYLLGKAEKWRL